ncbi:MAG: glycosyltransferase [Cyanobacteriota bacterium]|nr:glycosyltransferase [Cyanobacteriota bacterium]
MIIVPTLNSKHLLPFLVASLQEQTFPHWRVQFIDGPSHDEHRQWLTMTCNEDTRFCWEKQLDIETGIFGAMNQGIKHADQNSEWILFWGSDDQAASPFVLKSIADILEEYTANNCLPNLLICKGRYFRHDDASTARDRLLFGRQTMFIHRRSFRRSLFLGSTPPHQATFFGPGTFARLPEFSTDLRLSADLDYFLRLSRDPSIKIRQADQEVVWIGDGGISKQKTRRRLKEVNISYRKAFGAQWWIPFCLRYIQRIQSLFSR